MNNRTNTVGRHATTIRVQNDTTTITYHDTSVVAFDADTITFSTGGWNTATTKRRMNQTSAQFKLGYQVYARRWQWYVDYAGQTYPFTNRSLTIQRLTQPT